MVPLCKIKTERKGSMDPTDATPYTKSPLLSYSDDPPHVT
jgi:hypothetical protein